MAINAVDQADIKLQARKILSGNYGAWAIVAIVLIVWYWLTILLVETNNYFMSLGFILWVTFSAIFEIGVAKIVLNLINKKKAPELKTLFAGYADKRTYFGYLRVGIFTFLWSLLFVIPGIVKYLAYSQTFFLLAENDKMTAKEAQAKSIELMKWRKSELFTLHLSFIPWYLLMVITFGLAGFYVIPYIETTLGNYYNKIK